MDLFGDALRDRQAGHQGKMLTIRRDDGHTDAHDPGLYFTEAPFAHEVDLLAQAQAPVLDVGCGAGRTLLWLERHGIKATGIDLSPGAVDVSRSRGCGDVRHGDVMADKPDALAGDLFQTVFLFGNNLGIGGTIEGAANLLRRIAQLMQPGGHLFVTGLDIAQTEDPRHLAYHRANLSRGNRAARSKCGSNMKAGLTAGCRGFIPSRKSSSAWRARQVGTSPRLATQPDHSSRQRCKSLSRDRPGRSHKLPFIEAAASVELGSPQTLAPWRREVGFAGDCVEKLLLDRSGNR
ncbi:bifunctional 2-polyprenyl-6-hydroxyphenol methylase/3-demethylubiquinol 3-O-methyltransferase UbiG [Cognatishimia sp. MH4019]|uniref:class I SAM-dependent methyltransferase n=1 Tax=Cognatishimia sp. MH4019 TaxID=2854030 RepID=UPI001CD46EA4|nr:class I SAM-dependent methyltransferase [Cognatishimia sp. MH4019]